MKYILIAILLIPTYLKQQKKWNSQLHKGQRTKNLFRSIRDVAKERKLHIERILGIKKIEFKGSYRS